MESITQMLLREYGIQALDLQAVPAGWSASAWKVSASGGDYFLKGYDKSKPSTKVWVDRIDDYMPTVLWLNENTKLRGKMAAPILARDGAYKKEDKDRLYIVFPYIHGQTIGGGKLNSRQVREIAQIVAELHTYGAEIPAPTKGLEETFDVSFCTELADWLGSMHATKLHEALTPHRDALDQAIEALFQASNALHHAKLRYALCHTDIHGWNLMQGENLFLIDWEGLKLAPVEADLFVFTDTFFFADAWEAFLSVYRTVHKEYQVNEEALRFFRLRRRLEDIHAFAQSILFDRLTEDDGKRSIFYLERECELLHGMC